MTKITPVVAVGLLLGSFAPTALAVTETTFFSITDAQAYDVDISATDLINFGQSSFGSIFSTTAPNVGSLPKFNDGTGQTYGQGVDGLVYWAGTQVYGGAPGHLSDHPQVTVTFNLDPDSGGNALGYDLSNITSIYGWGDHASFNDQNFMIEWAPANDPGNFINLYTVTYGPFDPALDADGQPTSTKVILTDLGLTGVGALRFTFHPYLYEGVNEQGGQTLHEVDVFGTATVPEPSTIASLLMGGLLTLAFSRRMVRRTS